MTIFVEYIRPSLRLAEGLKKVLDITDSTAQGLDRRAKLLIAFVNEWKDKASPKFISSIRELISLAQASNNTVSGPIMPSIDAFSSDNKLDVKAFNAACEQYQADIKLFYVDNEEYNRKYAIGMAEHDRFAKLTTQIKKYYNLYNNTDTKVTERGTTKYVFTNQLIPGREFTTVSLPEHIRYFQELHANVTKEWANVGRFICYNQLPKPTDKVPVPPQIVKSDEPKAPSEPEEKTAESGNVDLESLGYKELEDLLVTPEQQAKLPGNYKGMHWQFKKQVLLDILKG